MSTPDAPIPPYAATDDGDQAQSSNPDSDQPSPTPRIVTIYNIVHNHYYLLSCPNCQPTSETFRQSRALANHRHECVTKGEGVMSGKESSSEKQPPPLASATFQLPDAPSPPPYSSSSHPPTVYEHPLVHLRLPSAAPVSADGMPRKKSGDRKGAASGCCVCGKGGVPKQQSRRRTLWARLKSIFGST